MKFKEYYDARRKIVDIVKEDLVGPVFDDEVINEPPTSYYIMGKLYPITNQTSADENNTTSADLEKLDEVISLASTNSKEPSAMGITFTVKPGVNSVCVECNYAMYKPYSLEKAREYDIDISNYESLVDSAKEDDKKRMKFWKREFYTKKYEINIDNNVTEIVADDVYLKSFLHMTTESGERIVSVVLTNEKYIADENRDVIATYSLFQPTIRVTGRENASVFSEVSKQVRLTDNEELLELAMLYMNKKCYAQGHGCSVVWDRDNDEPKYIESCFMPTDAVKQTKALIIGDNPVFKMHYLFNTDRNKIISQLKVFLNQYKDWISEQRTLSLSSIYVDHQEISKSNLDACDNICSRISEAIDILSTDNEKDNIAWKAFVYANEAMYIQRTRSIMKLAKEKGVEAKIDPDEISWYPFQLAFILLEIKSFVYPNSDDRKIVDLLWFPTGGGKTEAYLGISAFEIFYRRLSSPENCNGITIIMRYTLRLLTIQQFERASILICACELLREKYNIPGDEISIGLWVGNKFTPGTLDEADSTLLKIKETGQCGKEDVNPCQFKVCPWCGSKLYPKDYRVNFLKNKMEITCSDSECKFHTKTLPIHLIDEDIYANRPTFLVATVDKFAQIAIQDKCSALFSIDNDSLPPELIIQDELHLISGPLGTMTGIYEAAILSICESRGRAAKVVASTATIRNASNQILSLYGRKYNQFPAQGISADNSFFAVTASSEERPDRMYCGIMGVGTTFTTTLIRLYASWLFASRYLIDLGYDEQIIDNYWTLTGYFNSIRELGATQTQIVDDIQSRYLYLKENKFHKKYYDFSGDNRYENSVELTSRMSNDEISEIIQDKLKIKYTKENSSETYDFVLASNMISVGVDVSRLGVMAVAGQSKTNAEYIQATSRVGRSNPGLVFTVYNAVRSRDRSHYEQFSKYHSALYRYVEATSLTPFSDRARDRGLQALFVILCRYYCSELLLDNSAGNFMPDLEGVKRAEQEIFRYVNTVDKREANSVLIELKEIEKEWYEQAKKGVLWYKKKGEPSLLVSDTEEDRFRIMNSMRSVENESGIYLYEGGY